MGRFIVNVIKIRKGYCDMDKKSREQAIEELTLMLIYLNRDICQSESFGCQTTYSCLYLY